MNIKREVIICVSVVLALFLIIGIIYAVKQSKEDYTEKLISVLSEKNETTAQEIFSFEFARAYVFNDLYISGDGLADKYGLDISISEVEAGVSENIQRIVFVDEAGNFVYEFQCNARDVIMPHKALIIYPETVIKKEATQEKAIVINFESSEFYDH